MDWLSRENLNRKPSIFPFFIWGFPVNFPLNQSIEGIYGIYMLTLGVYWWYMLPHTAAPWILWEGIEKSGLIKNKKRALWRQCWELDVLWCFVWNIYTSIGCKKHSPSMLGASSKWRLGIKWFMWQWEVFVSRIRDWQEHTFSVYPHDIPLYI